MKLLGILAVTAIFFNATLNAQTTETELNGTPLASGVITVPTTATIQGNVCLGTGCPTPDPVDFWHITDGSGGAFRAIWSADVEVTLRGYPTSARNTAPSNTLLTSGIAVTLNASLFYSVSVRYITLGVFTNYSVKLGNNPPTASDFFIDDIYEGLSYTLNTSQFGYSDADGDPLNLIRIVSTPSFVAIYIDANDNDTFEFSERVLPGETVPKAEIDAGNFQLSPVTVTNTQFRFEVFDGFDYSATDYTVTIATIPIPTVRLSIDNASKAEQTSSDNVVTATLSNAYGANTTVNLSFNGTATNITDYTRSANSIIIPAGSTRGTITINNVDDALFEDDETVIVDIASVTNGNEAGNQQVTYTILDDDGPELSIVATTQAAEDATDGLFTVSTSQQFTTATNVTFTVGGNATPGTDYTALGTSFTFPANTNSTTITVPVLADNLVEPDETVTVTLTGTDNTDVTIGATDNATVTIIDNDVAELSIIATTQATEDGTDGLFTINTTKEFSAPVTVNVSVTGSATEGTDYSTLGTSFIFPANASSTTLNVAVLPDNLVEANETVIVTMIGTDNGDVTIGAADNATITITDNDVAALSIAATTQAAEDATDGLFTISTTNQFSNPVTVDITVGGSATEGTDYATIGTQIVFPANQNTVTIPIDVTADNILEPDETVMVTMTGTDNTNVSISATDNAMVTITDNDVAELSIVATTQAEEDATNGLFTISTSNQFTTATNVTIMVGGNATPGTDYTVLGSSFTFPANTNSTTISVPVLADNLVEPDETVTVTLTGTDNADVTIGATDNATVTITDNDVAELSIVATTQAAEDGTDGLFTINTTKEFSAPVTVTLMELGSAREGTDYVDFGTEFIFPANASSTTIPVEVLSDNLVEPDEVVIVRITGTDNGAVRIGSTQQATITITDNDVAELSIAATTQAAEDATDGLFTISTTNRFSTPVTVDITVGGSATEGTDYATIGTQIVFPANRNTVTIPVDVTADNILESDETVTVMMTGTNNAKVTIGSQDNAAITITDDDQATLSIVATTQAAEDATDGLFTISTSKQFTTAINVTFTVGGNATPGTDYTALGTSFTFPANTNSMTITVPVLADNLVEADETVTVTLTGTDNADVTIGATDNATVTISDNDAAELSIVATTQAAEDGTDGLFTINTTNRFSAPVTVNLSVTGTATAGTDYSSLGSSFTFPANASSTTLPVEVLSDNLVEANETVIVRMTGTDNGAVTIGAADDATITITDNDVAELSIAATTQAAEDATDGLFTIITTNQFSTPVTVDITVGGSAMEGTDYAAIGTQVVFPANRNTVTIPVDVTADNILESDETVTVMMTGTNNAKVTIGSPDNAAITITDNDQAMLSIVATTQAAEDDTDGLFTISTSKQFTTDVTVNFNLSGSATPTIDFTDIGSSFTFPANQLTTTITIEVVADDLDEVAETVILTLIGTDNADVTIGTPDNASITITDNDERPEVTSMQTFAVDEDAANTMAVGMVEATDSDAGTIFSNWTIVSGNPDGIFAIDPSSGQLSIIDNTNLDRETTASYTLSVTVSDGVNTSNAEDVVVNIRDVNDVLPVISSGQTFMVTEGIANGTILGTAMATDADVTATTLQNWKIVNGNTSTDGDGDLPFAIDPGTGQLSINDTDDINSSILTFSLGVTVSDGVNTSLTRTITVNVNAINDAPSFTVGNDQEILEDAGPQMIATWASNISAGPPDETAQLLIFNLSADNPGLFDQQPVVDVDGRLTFTPAANQFGSTTVTIFLSDNGGTNNGGVDRSADQTFNITVNAVNDAPAFIPGPDQTLIAGAADYTVDNWATDISTGPDNESAQTVTFNVNNDNNNLFATPPAINANGDLTFGIAEGVSGSATVSVSLSDDGGTANGGDDTSDNIQFTIAVGKLAQVITFDPLADKKVGEGPVDLVATGGASGNQVVFSISTNPATGVATLMNNTIILGNIAGTVTVTATQEGNNTFDPAEPVIRNFIVLANEAFLPTLFTPNGDGLNERFIIRGGGGVASIKFSILDKESNIVYESSDWNELSQNGWDGTSGGKKQPAGTYIWVVRGTAQSGMPLTINGKESGIFKLMR